MNDQQNRCLKRINEFISDEPDDIDIVEESPIDTSFREVLRWISENVLPVCTIALIINLTVMFTLPIEIAMSRWFWVKDPLSILLAFILVKAFNYLRNSVQIHH